MTDIFLSQNQIEELAFSIRGHKAKSEIIEICELKHICGRTTVFTALDPDTYDGMRATHRMVVNEAINFLREKYNHSFEWAEPIEA